ncbi:MULTISPECIES: P-type conjugative transfer protein TrbL [unclassified Mesorhizobium]|uniref:P-type conjugative transfer protein TrbL n=1 Tax=unclassified Mesorhizobium TaxID=325217 RepID=UPI0011292188|nr:MULTISPECIES: P-type conjugative transfer protein TrbL [unclassified Mesorhizobium]MBZ9898306.1 P-type conjugative transfer protein TrbL [Mesorhizobium sp. BR1-1-6]TPM57396.1 P-type conjugative transfer protein TrbL [Mesorhizobium sp. B2-2-4]TPM65800.1 P-type conjugative transfer protein TrbL [Mesorhizobium sp. B2-2-1]TPN30487.1 P-type conjugative transfer protein TrbL [Mesorhizobium sp. B1-1-6]TPN72126.1 P-type conjugative transfer protein TrbL [Mesorhizobium sp. B1-1-3]
MSRQLVPCWVLIGVTSACLVTTEPVVAQSFNNVVDTIQDRITNAAKSWETTILQAATSLFWLLALIEVGICAVWLAINSATLEAWFGELARRILFIGFFLFVLTTGPQLAKDVVNSLFQIGGGSGSVSPADVFDAGLKVGASLSEKVSFGLFEDNALATAAVFSMVVVVICFGLVTAIFIAVITEMYVGLLAGMIMLGFGGSSFTKDLAIRYLIYAFGVGMKLMALVMIANIGSDVLVGIADDPMTEESAYATTAIAGIAVIIFMVAMYVPTIVQGVVQGVSVTGGMEAIRHGGQAISAGLGAGTLAYGGTRVGISAYSEARQSGASFGSAAMKGAFSGVGSAGSALASAARDQAIGAPGSYGTSTLGLANAKLDAPRSIPKQRSGSGKTSSAPKK